jgi:hypothetical protein
MNNYLTIDDDPISNLLDAASISPQIPTQPPPPSSLQEPSMDINDRLKLLIGSYGKPIKLIILTPCYGGMTHVNYMVSLINTMEVFRKIGITLSVEFCKNDSLITRARNNLIAKAMNDPLMTHIIFIDNDITWTPIEIIKLLIANKDVVGGVYPLKNYKWERILDNQINKSVNSTINEKKANNSYLGDIDNETILKAQLLKYNMNPLSSTLSIDNNVTEIRHLPTGFMMLKRETIQIMFNKYVANKYQDDIGFLNAEEERYAYSLFDCGIIQNHYLSEDWMFCERWRELGGQIYMDISILLSHTGNEDYTGSFLLSL